MKKTIYVSDEHGDDKNDGLTEKTPVRTIPRAVEVSLKEGGQLFRVMGSSSMLERLNAELEKARKKKP